MAEADWTILTNSLSSASVVRGVTAGITPPNGGGSFVYGFNSLAAVTGAVGLFTNLANFSPMAKGADITGALMRGTGGGADEHSVFLFLGLGGTAVADEGYLFGLSDSDPAHIVLRKGSLINGLIDDSPGTSGVLARSTETVEIGTWVHLRLEMVVNVSGDVVLNVYKSDLSSYAVTAPSWAAVAGMSGYTGGIAATAFLDDALGVNSGSSPYTSGRGGYAFRCSDITRRAYVDHITLARQT